MSLERVEALLSKRVGFDATIIGSRKIARSVETRRVACGLSNLDAYLKILQSSTQEFDQLVERIVVPETWFFRDRKPFDFLVNYVRSEWAPKSATSKLRILSAPCSSGEEAYSIAISLLEAGLPVHQFSVDGIDISHHAIAKAQCAVYGKNSFRGADWVDRSRYFQQTGEKYALSASIRSLVNFRQGNLLNVFTFSQGKYDIIFCRNLLIYLDSKACDQVFTVLDRLLLPGGYLFLGSSETGKVPGNRFTSIRQPSTFAYRKVTSTGLGGRFDEQLKLPTKSTTITNAFGVDSSAAQSVKVTVDTKPVSSSLSLLTQAQSRMLEKLPSFNQGISNLSVIPSCDCPSKDESKSTKVISKKNLIDQKILSVSSDLNLKLVRQLADAGFVESAIAQCQQLLERDSTNAEAYTLLGTLYQARINYAQAEQCFRKALYLNPTNYDALMQLALLKEHDGDVAGAKVLYQRIQRLQQRF